MADEGAIAGKLSILVEAALGNFKKELETKVETAAKGVAAKVGIELDDKAEADLRSSLETVVKAAAKGVVAQVGIDVDASEVKGKVEAAAKAAKARASIEVDADTGSVVAETVAAAVAAEKAAPTITIRTRVASWVGGLRTRWREHRLEMAKQQAAEAAMLARSGMGAGGGALGGIMGFLTRPRTILRGSVIFGLVSLIQPAVGAIGQLVAGLTAMVGAAAPAVGTLASFPIVIGSMIQGFIAGRVAMQGMGDAMGMLAKEQAALARGEKLSEADQEKLNQVLSELSPSAEKAARALVSLRGEWVKVREDVQEALFSRIHDQIKPLAEKMLPLLRRELARTSGTLGNYTRKAMEFLQTDKAQADVGKVMKNNNVIFGDFLYMMGQFSKGSIDFLVASRKFGRGAGEVMRDVGDWFSGKAERGRKSGSTADFLDRASEKATQLWNITRQLAGGFAGIFRAAAPSGERLLATFEGIVTEWNKWVNSDGGQTFLEDWFNDAEKGFRELSALARDTFQGMAKWAADPKIAGMLEQIRTELGPKLGKVLQDIADISGEGTINFLTELTELASNLTPALEPMAVVVGGLVKLLDGLNAALALNPEVTKGIATVIGLLLAAKTAKGIAKIAFKITGLGALARAVGLVGALGTGKTFRGGFRNMLSGLGGGKNSKYGKGVVPVWVTNPGFGKPGTDPTVVTDGPDTDGKKKGWRGKLGDWVKKGAPWAAGSAASAAGAAGAGIGIAGLTSGILAQMGLDRSRKWGEENPDKKQVIAPPTYSGPFGGAMPGRVVMPGKMPTKEQYEQWADPAFIAKVKTATRTAAQNAVLDVMAGGAPKTVAERQRRGDLLAGPKVGKSTGQAAETTPFKRGGGASVGEPKKIKSVAAALGELAPRLRKIGDEYGTIGRRSSTMTKKQVADLRRVKKNVTDVPPRLKKMGDEYAGLGRKAIRSGQQTVKGTRSLETAARKAGNGVKRAAKQASESFDAIPKKMSRAAAQAGRQAGQIEKNVKSKTRTLPGTVRKAMDGVVKAVSSKAGPAKAASNRVGNGVKEPLSKLNGPLNAAGVNAMAGFEAGIRARGASAVAAARSIAAQVAAAANTELDIRSPSRVFMRTGRFAMEGLEQGLVKHGGRPVAAALNITKNIVKGVKSGLDQVKNIPLDGSLGKNLIRRLIPGPEWIVKEAEKEGEKATKKLSKAGKRRRRFKEMFKDFLTGSFFEGITKGSPEKVRKQFEQMYKKLDKIIPNTKAGKRRLRSIKREFRDEMRLMVENAKKREAVQKKIAEARAKLDEILAKRDNMREAFKNAADETGDIRNIAAANGGFISPGRLIAQLKRKVAKALEFKKLLADLRAKGLGDEGYQQLVELGFDEGLPIARQLAKGDSAALQEITALQSQLDDIAGDAAKESEKHFFAGGIKAGEAMLKELQKDLDQLEDLGRKMGKAFLSELESIFGLDLGVKNGGNLNSSTGKDDKDGGRGGRGKHKWVPVSEKNRKCKKCGKARNTNVHNNRNDAPRTGVAPADGPRTGAAPANARSTVMGALTGSAGSARAEAASADSYVTYENYDIDISGVPDKATAAAVLDEAYFQIKKNRNKGRKKRGRATR